MAPTIAAPVKAGVDAMGAMGATAAMGAMDATGIVGAIVVVLGTLAACGGGPPTAMPMWPDERVWTSAHFRYHSHADDTSVCEETLLELEAHFEATRAFLRIDGPTGARIDYYKYRSLEELQQRGPCRVPSGGAGVGTTPPAGCTVGRTLYSGFPIHEHELNHTYLADVGDPPDLLLEGVAEMLACRTGAWDQVTLADLRTLGWAEVVRWGRYDARLFQGAVLLVRHLVARFGIDGLMRLYRDAPRPNDVDSFEAAVAIAFGEPLDNLWNAALDSPPRGGSCLAPYACAAPPLTPAGGAMPRACGVPTTVRSLELTTETSLALTFAPGMEKATVRSCDGQHAVPWPELGSALFADTLLVRLEAGRYAITWERSTSATASAPLPSLQIAEPPDTWISADCAAAAGGAFDVRSAATESEGITQRLVVAAFAAGGSWSVGLDFPIERPVVLAEMFGFASQRARLCRVCDDDPSTCTIFPASAPARPMLVGTHVLTLPTTTSGETFSGVSLVMPSP